MTWMCRIFGHRWAWIRTPFGVKKICRRGDYP